ncbi:ankyrin repeat domain-containing protein [Flavobacterium sp. XS2P12]|uniref:ankyrin repeat domain-containing protein n=1 Tax=Flavobacterium melibiosi TaxID=3398734 RepID=UPI003A899B97
MKKTLLLICLISLISLHPVHSQAKIELKWSQWIPIIDRNENKILFSVAYEKPPYNPGVVMYFRIQNKYNEPITGRFNIKHATKDGRERFNSFLFHCIQPQNIQVDDGIKWIGDGTQMIMNVQEIKELKFIEFSSCSTTSKIIAYTKKDTALFRLQNAMIKNQIQRIKNDNVSVKGNNKTNTSATKNITGNFSDAIIYYKGKNQENIIQLLSKVKGWRTNSGLNIQDGIPPQVPINNACQRDQYVFSAVLYSWATESYYRLNEKKKAETSAEKVGELITTVNRLCGDGISLIDINCKTAELYPCSESSAKLNISTNSSGSTIVNSNIKNDDTKKEKELLYGLLPLAAMAFKSDYNPSDEKYISDIMSKLDAYVEDDDQSDLGTKLFMKLASLNIQDQLSELNGMTNNMTGSVINNTNPINNFGTVNSTNSFSEMSDTEIKQTLAPLTDAVYQLLMGTEDEYGQTKTEEKYLNKRLEEYRETNRELKLKHGYTMDDFTLAIRNFDDELLDKILATGFPVNIPIRYKKSDAGQEIGFDRYGLAFGNQLENPIHYAAKYGNVYAIKKLVANGANIRGPKTSTSWKPPIFHAIENNHYEAVQVLFELGIDPGEKIWGKSKPIDLARELGRDEIVDLIKSFAKK